ncbi:MAG: peptidylprolyl isomerase [Deltaproteobacteria bacterium]|nr:peptidylprolyl isomerase [Deltaproteobacteria bacterium]
MAEAKKGDMVKVHYTGTLDDGSVFDTSDDSAPIEFVVGGGALIPAFEDALVGMNTGESKTVRINAEDAYGPFYPDMVIDLDKGALPGDLEPQVDMMLEMEDEDGFSRLVRVVELSDTSVTIDANHPLAGKDLTFKVELVEIL